MNEDQTQETYEDISKSDKLKEARAFFEDAVEHARNAHAEAHRAARFYHNTRNEGQWEQSDLQYLRENLRPAYTFNIVKDKVDSALGIYADAQRTPIVVGSGGDDQLLAEIIDAVKDQVLQDANWDRKSAGWLKTGAVHGECGMQVSVRTDQKKPGWVMIELYRIMPFELHWDAASIEPDRSDARHVFWSRWFREEEFDREYPEKKGTWSQLAVASDPSETEGDFSYGEASPDGVGARGLDDYNTGTNHYYWDRHNRKARIIRYEYKTFVTEQYAVNELSGERRKIETDEEAERLQMAVSMGAPFVVEEIKVERVKVCDFVGTQILREYDEPGPFDGFSVEDFVYMMDEEDGTPYGAVRNLIDPQMELNKSKSLEIEHIAQSVAVGVISEAGALVDETQFVDELRRPGGNAQVKTDALSQGRVIVRQPSPPNEAVMARARGAVDLLQVISGIPSGGNVVPAEFQQSAAAAYLRYHKARQVVRDPIGNYENAQKGIVRRIVETIARAMPDDQIEAILSNREQFIVRQGMAVELGPSPDGNGKVPKKRAMLRDLRSMNWNLELAHTTENSTLRMMEFEVMLNLLQAGVPVDPEVLVETATSSRGTRERLKAFIEQTQRASAEAKAQEAQMFSQQTAGMLKIEAAKAQETSRHNQASEFLQGFKTHADIRTEMAAIWEKADANEKQMILDMLRESTTPAQSAAY